MYVALVRLIEASVATRTPHAHVLSPVAAAAADDGFAALPLFISADAPFLRPNANVVVAAVFLEETLILVHYGIRIPNLQHMG